jgi:hypothetical protein
VKVFEGEKQFCSVESAPGLVKLTFPLEMVEELSSVH